MLPKSSPSTVRTVYNVQCTCTYILYINCTLIDGLTTMKSSSSTHMRHERTKLHMESKYVKQQVSNRFQRLFYTIKNKQKKKSNEKEN